MPYTGGHYVANAFTADGLLPGHTVSSIDYTGGASQPGVHEGVLRVENPVITDDTGADVTANYAITCIFGDLTVTGSEITDDTVRLSADTLYLRTGDKVQLTVTRRTTGAVLPLEWHSDSADVTVTDDGVITCHATGSATITLTYPGMSEVVARCTILPDDMKQLSLPTMLAQVEEEAWLNNAALQVVDLSNAIEPVIGDRAFKGCGSLVKVLLPEATAIVEDAFDGCGKLVLYCTDADAAAYAKENGIPYVMLLQVGN